MSDYRFCVSLRISHPEIDPDEITRELGIEPFRKWKVGEARVSPSGEKIEGESVESFWAAKLHEEKRLLSTDIYLEDFISKLNEQFKDKSRYFSTLVESGGYIEYFVGWFGGGMFGATLDPTLLASTGKLSISIGLDIYGGEDE